MRKWMIIFLLSPLAVSGQLQVTVSSGYASFAMGDMGVFQKQMKNESRMDAKIISSFPSYWYYDASVIKTKDDLAYGLSFDYTSTGGRISYNDYSGGFTVDQLLSSVGGHGIVGNRFAISNEKYTFVGQVRCGVLMTKFHFAAEDGLASNQQGESHNFKSISVALQPAVTVTRRFGWFGVQALAGYHITLFQGKLFYEQDKKAYLLIDADKPLRADWSGLRVTLGAAFYILE